MKTLLAITVLWLASIPGIALACGDLSELEMVAYTGKLDEAQRTCLESSLETGDSVTRAQHSFVLIIDAYIGNEKDRYEALMRRHLTEIHTTDAEVAYLFVNHLFNAERHTDEALHFARVAMDGRRRWLHNRTNYDRMVKATYDMMVQMSMARAIDVEQEYKGAPTQEKEHKLEQYRRQARYYLIIAAPCLHYGDCGPYFDVEIEGWAPCDDLVALEGKATRGGVTQEEVNCLRGKYRKNGAPRRRILDIMMDQADFDRDGRMWEELLAWHWNLTGLHDPMLAHRYAQYLVAHGEEQAAEALNWADIALEESDSLSGRRGRDAVRKLHELRVRTAEELLQRTRNEHDSPDLPEAQQAIREAEERLAGAVASRDSWCAANDCE